jgi:hypothetical protein
MNNLIRVIPNEGYKILHPFTFRTIPPEGEIVESAYYWLAREAEGGVRIEKLNENPVIEPETNKEIPAQEPAKTNEEI